jgi:hypothetical protein
MPYVGIFQTDITFIEDGNKNFVHGLINVYKQQLVVSKVLAQMQIYQNKAYDFHPVPQIQNLFLQLPAHDKREMDRMDKLMFDQSLRLEPRNADRSQIN